MNKMDMTSGNLWKQIMIFSLPLIFSYVLQILFNMADVAVVGQFCGENQLASVGSTTILISFFTGFSIGVGGGVNSLVARYIGARNKDFVQSTVHTSFILSIIIGIILAIISVSTARPLLILIKTKAELLNDAVTYVKIYFCGLPALTIFNYGTGVFSAKGNTKKPLIYLVISGILNVIMNLIFVLQFKLEVKGVAYASIISQYISATLVIISLIRTKDDTNLSFRKLRLDKYRTIEVLKLSLPAGLQSSIFAIANLFIQSAVNTFDTVMVAGNTAAANADTIIYTIMAAIYLGCSSFISQNFGAGKKSRMMMSYIITTIYSFGIAFILGLFLFIFGRQFLSIFTSDSDVIECGYKRLVIMAFSYCVSAFMDNTLAASRGLGKTIIPSIIVVLGSCVFRVAWIYTIFEHFKTIQSLYLLYVFSWILTSIGEIVYFVYIYKKSIKILEG